MIAVPYCLFHVEWAMAMWYFVSLFQPQTQSYSFARSIPYGAISGIVVIIGWLIHSDRKLPKSTLVMLLLALGVWTTLTTIFAVNPSISYRNWNLFISLLVMVLVGTVVINTRQRLEILIWVIALSVGYYTFKVGLFALRGGRGANFLGPAYMNGNNEIARGALMLLPLLVFMFVYWKKTWIRMGLTTVIGGTLSALILSGSRGAWLAFAAMIFAAATRIRRGIVWVGLALALGVALVPLLPPEIVARFHSISDYENDGSVQGRIRSWEYAFEKFPERPFMGGGFDIFDWEHHKASHNSYIQMLGEHGSIGLLLFLLLLSTSFVVTQSIANRTRHIRDLKWASNLAIAIQLSLVGYAVGSLSINEAFFPIFHTLIGLLASLQLVVQKELAMLGVNVSSKSAKRKAKLTSWPPSDWPPPEVESGLRR